MKAVYKYDKDTGRLLGRYQSIREAALAVGGCPSSIGIAAKGNRTLTSAGYIWSFTYPFTPRNKIPHEAKRKPVGRLDRKTLQVVIYNSLIEAADANFSHRQNVSKAIRDSKAYLGYDWFYIDKLKEKIDSTRWAQTLMREGEKE